MEKSNNILKAKEVLPMSDETKERIAEVAKKIEGKELFTEAIERAKKSLEGIKKLPV